LKKQLEVHGAHTFNGFSDVMNSRPDSSAGGVFDAYLKPASALLDMETH
jgi:hypothetical protein